MNCRKLSEEARAGFLGVGLGEQGFPAVNVAPGLTVGEEERLDRRVEPDVACDVPRHDQCPPQGPGCVIGP